MKKYFLSIWLALVFFVSYAGTVNHSLNQRSLISSQINESGYSENSFKYPHTEIEILQHAGVGRNIARSQKFTGFINLAIALNFGVNYSPFLLKDDSLNFSFKNYLFHIYPSHNFW